MLENINIIKKFIVLVEVIFSIKKFKKKVIIILNIIIVGVGLPGGIDGSLIIVK